MLTNKELWEQLHVLGLTPDEATFYLELLKKPTTHLQLSRTTGIERARIYRIADKLEKRSLLTRMTDDSGTFLVAADPAALEIDLAGKEQQLKRQRRTLSTLLPSLNALQGHLSGGFSVKTYEGQAGLKQMCWNELKTKGEIIVFGHGNIETVTNDHRWAVKHRARQVNAKYRNRDLVNEDWTDKSVLAHDTLYDAQLYTARMLPSRILKFVPEGQTVVYNDVVEIFHWKDDRRVGVEITSQSYATMLRQLFDDYWRQAQKISIE